MSNETPTPTGWDMEMLERYLDNPKRGWGRDITPRGLETTIHSDANPCAQDVTGQKTDTVDHTAVWLVLALAGRGRVGTAGSGVSLGDYLGSWTGRGRDHYRRVVNYTPGTEPERTVRTIAAVLGGRTDNLPDPLLLATDLVELLSPDAEVRYQVAMRWACSLDEPVTE